VPGDALVGIFGSKRAGRRIESVGEICLAGDREKQKVTASHLHGLYSAGGVRPDDENILLARSTFSTCSLEKSGTVGMGRTASWCPRTFSRRTIRADRRAPNPKVDEVP
jgi:hypothetical protein